MVGVSDKYRVTSPVGHRSPCLRIPSEKNLMKTLVASRLPVLRHPDEPRSHNRLNSHVVSVAWPRAWKTGAMLCRGKAYFRLWDDVFGYLLGKVGPTRRVCITRSRR